MRRLRAAFQAAEFWLTFHPGVSSQSLLHPPATDEQAFGLKLNMAREDELGLKKSLA